MLTYPTVILINITKNGMKEYDGFSNSLTARILSSSLFIMSNLV
jgi:hypothetical protein